MGHNEQQRINELEKLLVEERERNDKLEAQEFETNQAMQKLTQQFEVANKYTKDTFDQLVADLEKARPDAMRMEFIRTHHVQIALTLKQPGWGPEINTESYGADFADTIDWLRKHLEGKAGSPPKGTAVQIIKDHPDLLWSGKHGKW